MIDHEQRIGDQNVRVVAIPTISLKALNSGDYTVQQELREAASDPGFFYLDLSCNLLGDRVLADLQDLYALADKYFTQTEEVKLRDVRKDITPSQDLGYKSSPCDETFEISWHEVVTTGASHLPPLLRTQGLSLQRFSAACQELCLAILKGLSPDLLVHHRSGQPSETGLKFISEPALEKASDVGDYTHTDGGTLTMLFYSDWGLQTLLKESQKWAFIAPKDDCVVVNVADSLERLSGGRFHSPKHRITQPTDGQAKRYYLSYFLRPELAVKASWAAQ